MKEECLIDFDPFPIGCPVWYDDGDTQSDGWNNPEDFLDVYDQAESRRIADRHLFLRMAMCERLLSEAEEAEAHNAGLPLANGDYKLLSDLWFQQRRLKALKKGLLLS